MILMNDFKAEPGELREAMLSAVARVLDSGWYVLGKEVEAFERQWAAACGAKHGIGVGNGMDAIEIALRTLDIGPGDEVITTPMTAFATVLAILRTGATPVLADIDADCALLSLASVERCLSKNTKAVLLVHLYGQVRQMDVWTSLCDRNGVHLVEDCAQAHLAAWHGKVAGSFGRIGAYSFYPTKNLGTVGDAGMVICNDAELDARARRLRNYGQSDRYHHPVLGMNSRLDEIHAAILAERMRWLDGFTARRREIAEAYFSGIRNPRIRLLTPPEESDAHVYHLYVVVCSERDALQSFLRENGVQTLVHYPVPVHAQAPCRGIARDPLGLAGCEHHATTCLSLPCHPQMSDADIEHVIAAANRFGNA